MTEGAGHNSLGVGGAEQLRAYVKRIERIQSEVDELNATKQEVYGEARAAGFDKKTLRKVILRRSKNLSVVNDEDDLLDLYEAILQAADSLE